MMLVRIGKMDQQTKRNINKLAKKFNHEIEYDKHDLHLKSNLNKIVIKKSKKDLLSIEYNTEKQTHSIEIDSVDVYDILFQLFWREERKFIKPKNAHPITWDLFIEIELDEEFWLSVFRKLKVEIDSNEILFREIGGNRILVEYYDNLLIFHDDLNYFKSNVFGLGDILKK